MALRTILTEEDKQLYKVSREVTSFGGRIDILLDDMRETLIESEGVGLAAPQVGVLRRVVLVMDTNKEDLTPEEQIIELINPVIVSTEGEQDGLEGCLSVPGIYGYVKRPYRVTVKAFDRTGKEFLVTGEGLTARAFCHEIDHLDGHLYKEFAYKVLTPEELEALESSYSEDDMEEEAE